MYQVRVTGKDGVVMFKVKTGQQARGIAKVAKASGLTFDVVFSSEPRKVEFKDL